MFHFLVFHPFFRGNQLTPFAPMCGRPWSAGLSQISAASGYFGLADFFRRRRLAKKFSVAATMAAAYGSKIAKIAPPLGTQTPT